MSDTDSLNRIVVVGASAGGVEALSQLVAGLPPDFRAAVLVVVHFPAGGTSVLPQILDRAGTLPASHATDGEAIEPGRIYVARPDWHLLVHPRRLELWHGPVENGHRPAIDTLFRSAATVYGASVVGVILSGTQDDGTAGLHAVKTHGGVAVVQDPADALFAGMPLNAMEHVEVDHCLPVAKIPRLLVGVTRQPTGARAGAEKEAAVRTGNPKSNAARLEGTGAAEEGLPGKLTGLTCPNCGGALWELRDGNIVRYRCRIGHLFSPESLDGEQAEALEGALWAAVRALQERAALARRLAQSAESRAHPRTTQRFDDRAREAERRAALIRDVLLGDSEGEAAPAAEPTATSPAPDEDAS